MLLTLLEIAAVTIAAIALLLMLLQGIIVARLERQAGGSLSGLASAPLLFLKSTGGGIVAVVIVAWILVFLRMVPEFSTSRAVGLGAVAGGWEFLLRSPLACVILGLAFGAGYWIAART
jgi:hypothetical protein